MRFWPQHLALIFWICLNEIKKMQCIFMWSSLKYFISTGEKRWQVCCLGRNFSGHMSTHVRMEAERTNFRMGNRANHFDEQRMAEEKDEWVLNPFFHFFLHCCFIFFSKFLLPHDETIWLLMFIVHRPLLWPYLISRLAKLFSASYIVSFSILELWALFLCNVPSFLGFASFFELKILREEAKMWYPEKSTSLYSNR